MLTDTHAHLDFPDFADDLPDVLARATAAGVTRLITIGTSLESSRRAVELAHVHRNVYAAIGIHPNNALEAPEDVVSPLRELARHPKVVAIGECGLDYHRLPTDQARLDLPPAYAEMPLNDPAGPRASIAEGGIKAAQAVIFEQQLDLAVELGLNMIIHERDAWRDTLAILEPYHGKLRTVFHCFGKSLDAAEYVLDRGHLISFTGIVTFKNAAVVQQTATNVPEGSFMVETDCPFLAPAPHRGKRCEPAHVRIIADHVATLRNTTVDALAEETERTADAFFRFASSR